MIQFFAAHHGKVLDVHLLIIYIVFSRLWNILLWIWIMHNNYLNVFWVLKKLQSNTASFTVINSICSINIIKVIKWELGQEAKFLFIGFFLLLWQPVCKQPTTKKLLNINKKIKCCTQTTKSLCWEFLLSLLWMFEMLGSLHVWGPAWTSSTSDECNERTKCLTSFSIK